MELFDKSFKSALRPVSLLAGLVFPACVAQGDRGVTSTEVNRDTVVASNPNRPLDLSAKSTAPSSAQATVNETSLGGAILKGINRPIRDLETAWYDPGVVVDAVRDGLLDAAVRQARRSVVQEMAFESNPERQQELADLLLPRANEYGNYVHRDVLTDRAGSYETFRPLVHGVGRVSFGIVDDRADSVKFRLRTPSGSWALRTISGDCSVGDYFSHFGASLTFRLPTDRPTSVCVSGDRERAMIEVVTIF